MIRKDQEYWQRLRVDKKSNIAAIFTGLAMLVTTITVIGIMVHGTQFESRSNPLYWILMLPMVWWINGLASFEPLFVRNWKVALVVVCLINAGCLAYMIHRQDAATFYAASLGLTLLFAGMSMYIYRGSLVAREGPAR